MVIDHRGTKNPNSKLTEQQVSDIRVLLAAGLSCRKIACIVGVSHATIGHIRTGRRWGARVHTQEGFLNGADPAGEEGFAREAGIDAA